MSDKFYNVNGIPFFDRESFNNAVLLLTMIKSEYYYIISFSREKGIINIGFDFKDKYYGSFSETMSIDFNSSDEEVIIKAEINNFSGEKLFLNTENYIGEFSVINNKANYIYKIKKDKVFPLSKKEINQNILNCKNDILEFINESEKYNSGGNINE